MKDHLMLAHIIIFAHTGEFRILTTCSTLKSCTHTLLFSEPLARMKGRFSTSLERGMLLQCLVSFQVFAQKGHLSA